MLYTIAEFSLIIQNCKNEKDIKWVEDIFEKYRDDYIALEVKIISSRIERRKETLKTI